MRAGMAVAVALCLVAAPASGATVTVEAKLTGAAESPPNTAAGKGKLTARLDTDTRLLTYKVSFSGLTGPATMAHFHGPARPGANAPPIVVVADPSSPISGEASLTPAQVSDLEKGLWYFNVHTAANPGGELRGQLKRHIDWNNAETPPGAGQDLRDIWRPPTPAG